MFLVVDTTLSLYITLNRMLVIGHSSSIKYFVPDVHFTNHLVKKHYDLRNPCHCLLFILDTSACAAQISYTDTGLC